MQQLCPPTGKRPDKAGFRSILSSMWNWRFSKEAMERQVQCPFVYANGRRCGGHVVAVWAVPAAAASWYVDKNGEWQFSVMEIGGYAFACSKRGGHRAGTGIHPKMVLRHGDLPDEVRQHIVERTLMVGPPVHWDDDPGPPDWVVDLFREAS